MMQAGGNAAARKYFESNGVTAKDLKTKYASAGAARYRSKLEAEADKLQRKLGDNLFENEDHAGSSRDTKDGDFFESNAHATTAAGRSQSTVADTGFVNTKAASLAAGVSLAGGSTSPSTTKKPLKLTKKGGLGAKKIGVKKAGALGGVKKVSKLDFEAAEKKAAAMDEKAATDAAAGLMAVNLSGTGSKEGSSGTTAPSARLSYQAPVTKSRDMSKMTEAKRAQAERLGMGMAKQTTNAAVFAHSTRGAMQDITQEETEEAPSSQWARGSYLDREPGGLEDELAAALGFADAHARANDEFFSRY